jgi:hypothetical protein
MQCSGTRSGAFLNARCRFATTVTFRFLGAAKASGLLGRRYSHQSPPFIRTTARAIAAFPFLPMWHDTSVTSAPQNKSRPHGTGSLVDFIQNGDDGLTTGLADHDGNAKTAHGGFGFQVFKS